MANYWCCHCQKLVKLVVKRNQPEQNLGCPFCGAGEYDLFLCSKSKIKVPKGSRHGYDLGYPTS